ncbi:MAG: VWA domain-containing protein [Treponema sp.]|jgi:hypothetical protein|nr:VWA domain-containing protein [Treponema sp.]
MKKVVFAFVFILGVSFTVFGQEPIDLILLLDTSSSMSGSYGEVNNYMTGAFLKEFLRIGDTFHLIPFSGTPRVDISRRVEGRGDVETIIGRMLLQYPLEPGSDISAALSYAEKYAATLPARPKKIILLTDGNTVSAPGGAAGTADPAGFQNLIAETKTRLGRQGIVLEYVKVPLTALPSSGRPPQAPVSGGTVAVEPSRTPVQPPRTQEPARQPQTPAAAEPSRTPVQPPQTGQTSETSRSAPSGQAASSGQTAPVRGTEGGIPDSPAVSGGPRAAETPPAGAGSGGSGPVSAGPSSPQGRAEAPGPAAGTEGVSGPERTPDPAEPQPSQTGRIPGGDTVSPAPTPASPASSPSPAPARQYNQRDFSSPLVIVLALLGLAALGLIIFLVTRRLQGTPARAMARAAAARPEAESPPAESRFADHSAALANYAATQRPRTGPYAHRYTPQNVEYEGPLMLNLFVEDQSTLIGKRNIHAVKPGYTFTVGGGRSDFLIFLVPIPPHIGEVRCDGNRCTFIPRKPQYFPDIGSQQVPDCIGKTIRIISDKKYELHFRMERYEDPLKALNRLLRSVQVPG